MSLKIQRIEYTDQWECAICGLRDSDSSKVRNHAEEDHGLNSATED